MAIRSVFEDKLRPFDTSSPLGLFEEKGTTTSYAVIREFTDETGGHSGANGHSGRNKL